MAQTMSTAQFIEVLFIKQIGEIVPTHHYLAFISMGVGIEFLGKCLNSEDFNEERVSRKRFEEAINQLQSFTAYRFLTGKDNKFDLYSCLRCGLAHAGAPKYPITLSSKNETPNLTEHDNGNRMNLRCEDFYSDFVNACYELLGMPDPIAKKLTKPFLSVPEYNNEIATGQTPVTESLNRQ